MERIVAIGAGRMGRGIAQFMAYAGFEVGVVDLKQSRPPERFAALAQDAHRAMAAGLEVLREAGLIDATGVSAVTSRISVVPESEAGDVIAGADVIFEGVPEVLKIKRPVLARVSRLARADAIVASTTSTFSPELLSGSVCGPERFLNAHWLNPAPLVPLVELSPAGVTDPAVVDRLEGLLRRAGKRPVRCRAAPGYIVPRIQTLAMNEAARIVEQGVATAEAVDEATRYGFGLRFAVLGLAEFIDFGGGDILYYASNYLREALDDERYAAPAIIEDNMAAGRNGLREGVGFHDYRARDTEAYRRETVRKFLDLLAHLELIPRPDCAKEP